jgi:hypothetical protein
MSAEEPEYCGHLGPRFRGDERPKLLPLIPAQAGIQLWSGED